MEITKWYPEYDKVSIIVFTENNIDKQKYFNLFRLILSDKIEKIIDTSDRKEIIADKVNIRLFTKVYASKGNKAHYVLNLTQDKDFDSCVATPITVIFDYLKDDPKWSDLFTNLK